MQALSYKLILKLIFLGIIFWLYDVFFSYNFFKSQLIYIFAFVLSLLPVYFFIFKDIVKQNYRITSQELLDSFLVILFSSLLFIQIFSGLGSLVTKTLGKNYIYEVTNVTVDMFESYEERFKYYKRHRDSMKRYKVCRSKYLIKDVTYINFKSNFFSTDLFCIDAETFAKIRQNNIRPTWILIIKGKKTIFGQTISGYNLKKSVFRIK